MLLSKITGKSVKRMVKEDIGITISDMIRLYVLMDFDCDDMQEMRKLMEGFSHSVFQNALKDIGVRTDVDVDISAFLPEDECAITVRDLETIRVYLEETAKEANVLEGILQQAIQGMNRRYGSLDVTLDGKAVSVV